MTIQYKTALDKIFHALGDETRRGMLAQLAIKGTQSASELSQPYESAQPTLSKHLKVLEKAGLVSRKVEGRIHRFRLETEPFEEAQDWINRHKDFWEDTLDRLGVYIEGVNNKEKNK